MNKTFKFFFQHFFCVILFLSFLSCKNNSAGTKESDNDIIIDKVYVGNHHIPNNTTLSDLTIEPELKIKITLEKEIDPEYFTWGTVKISENLFFDYSFIDNKTIQYNIHSALKGLTSYKITIPQGKNEKGGNVVNGYSGTFTTAIDSTDKFPRIPDEELLTKV